MTITEIVNENKALQASKANPARLASRYLARLAEGSRPAQTSALRYCSLYLWGSDEPDEVPWEKTPRPAVLALCEELRRDKAPATGRRVLAALRGVLRECWVDGRIDTGNLERLFDGVAIKGTRTRAGRSLSPSEVECLTRDLGVRDRALILTMVCGGLRRGEVAALRQCDVQWSDGEIELRVRGKGGKERTVYLTGSAAYAMACLWGDVKYLHSDAPLFGLSLSGLAKRLGRILRRVKCTSHDLRRTYASVALDNGVDLATVQAVLGHTDPRTTSGYDRRDARAQRSAAQAVDGWLTQGEA